MKNFNQLMINYYNKYFFNYYQLHGLQDIIRSQPAQTVNNDSNEMKVLRQTAENAEAELTQLQGLYADAQMKIFDMEV